MFTIYINIGNQTSAVNILSGHTPRQILDYLRQNGIVSQFQAGPNLLFSGGILPLDEPVGDYGVGPGSTLQVRSHQGPGFGGSGKEALLNTLLNAFKNLK